MLFFVLIRLFGYDDHDDVELTFGSLSKKKEEEKQPVRFYVLLGLVL